MTLQPTASASGAGPRLPPSTARPAVAGLLRAPVAVAVMVVGLLGIGLYFVIPGRPQDVLFVVYGSSAAILLVWGAVHYLRGRDRIPWLLIAVSQAAFSAGDAILNFYPDVTGHVAPFPSAGDIAYLAAYPFLTAGIYMLVRRLASVEGLFVYIDAALMTGAFALVQWVFMIEPYLHHVDESVYGRIVLMTYPAVDVLLVAVLARFFVTPAWRTPAYALLVLAVICLVGADEVYVNDINGYMSGQWSDALWLLSYLLLAVTAQTPSMRTLSLVKSVHVPPRLTTARLALLALALLSAPVTLLLRADERGDGTIYLVGAAATALSLLALVRIFGLVQGMHKLRITEERAREEVEAAHQRLAAQNERLIAADRMKDEFIGMISHDLRTPLVSATGFLELLADGDAGELNDGQRRYVEFVQRASDRLLRQIEDLLVAASLQAGSFSLERSEVDVAQIAEESVEGQRAVAAAKDVELLLSLEPAPAVDADPLRLAQVVDNLLSNAVKFTPQGGRIDVHVFAGAGRTVLEVADSGIGIADAEQTALFERFFRSSNVVAQRIPGSGLGLYIVKSLVEAHGGVITVRSAAGEGTTLRVELPAAGAGPLSGQPAGGR